MEAIPQMAESIYQLPQRGEIIRMVVLGDEGVGKSAFIKCSMFGSYDPFLKSALGLDFMTRDINVEDDKVVLQLWESSAPVFNAAVVVYEVTNRETFVNAVKTVEELREKHGLNLPILLLANKADVEHKRQIMIYEGEMIALQLQVMFNEISCTESSNTRESMVEMIESLLTFKF